MPTDISITIEAQTAVDKAVERAKKKQAADQPDWKSIPKGQKFELLRERFDLYNFFICAIKLEFQLFNYSTQIQQEKKAKDCANEPSSTEKSGVPTEQSTAGVRTEDIVEPPDSDSENSIHEIYPQLFKNTNRSEQHRVDVADYTVVAGYTLVV